MKQDGGMNDDLFDFTPVAHNHTEGSKQAARKLANDPDRLSELQTRIFYVVKNHPDGMTRGELLEYFSTESEPVKENTLNGRCNELIKMGKLTTIQIDGKDVLRGGRSILRVKQ